MMSIWRVNVTFISTHEKEFIRWFHVEQFENFEGIQQVTTSYNTTSFEKIEGDISMNVPKKWLEYLCWLEFTVFRLFFPTRVSVQLSYLIFELNK